MTRSKVRVLMVDDSLQDAVIVRRMLRKAERLDFEVDWVQSTRECLERLKEKPFDVLLLDYNLPGEDGLAFLRSLSGKAHVPPIIMLSGWGGEGVAAEALRYGAHSYFPKSSINSDALTLKIQEALDKQTSGEPDETSSTKDTQIVSTGDAQLDYRMGGGIPAGSLTLIDGQLGAGKSVLAQHLIWGGLKAGYRVVLYSNENTNDSLLGQMASLGMDVANYSAQGKLRVYEIPVSNADGLESANLAMLHRHMSQLRDCDVIVVDSLTGFIANPSDQDVFSFFTHCKQYYAQGKTVIATVHANAFSDSVLSAIVSICDVYLRLRIEVMADKLLKRLDVAKIRGANKVTGRIVTFDVEPGLGIVPAMVFTKVNA
jgi:flagellar protein FlaH